MPIGAAIGAATISAGATIYSSNKASGAAKDAANAQTQAADAANKLQWDMFQQQREDAKPWRDAGMAALGQLQEFLKPGADLTALLQATPGYQFRMQEGVNALDRSAAARGMLNSGGHSKSLLRYGQGVASDEFTNMFNRYSAVAGIGQQVNQSNNQLAQNYANNASNNLINAGQARASGYQQQGQAAGAMAGGLANIGVNLLGQFGGGGSALQPYTPMNPIGPIYQTPAGLPQTNVPGLTTIPQVSFG